MSAGAPSHRGTIEGRPVALGRGVVGVPVAGWTRSRDSDGRLWIDVEPVALIVARACGTQRMDLGAAAAYPSPVDPGPGQESCTEDERVTWLDAAFGPLSREGQERRLPFRRARLPAAGRELATSTERGVLLAAAGVVRLIGPAAVPHAPSRGAPPSDPPAGHV